MNLDLRLPILFVIPVIVLNSAFQTSGELHLCYYIVNQKIRIPKCCNPLNSCLLGKQCKDDENWTDSKYGEGLFKCSDMTLDDCENYAEYSAEARRACPEACNDCNGMFFIYKV